MEEKFKAGDFVVEKIRPAQKLIVSRYSANAYYCKVSENPGRKELVFHERELAEFKGGLPNQAGAPPLMHEVSKIEEGI